MSFDRSDVGSWLEGPRMPEDSWPGKRLGFPKEGRGSVASFGRRAAGLIIDWVACLAISALFFHGNQIATLLVFWAEQTLLVGLLGTSLGHRIVGVRVEPLEGAPTALARAPFLVRSLVRSTMLALFIPALVMNTDLRGLNDQAAGTVVVRR
ncbi:RDD family protein [Arthrobacter sp. UM1]|uniref:RDD family protein n=1 Tax=Arthrobacter sp. UM1 TaxID=2766776 RepID=UPI001CF67EFC|nr:RDD family protein [Arthrobacter sp. UM1]